MDATRENWSEGEGRKEVKMLRGCAWRDKADKQTKES